MTRDTAERARELIYKLQAHVTVGETFKGGACASWTYDKCVALILAHDTQIQAEARLEEAKKWKPLECQQESHHPLRSPICRTCQKMARWEERIAALAQALQPEEKEK